MSNPFNKLNDGEFPENIRSIIEEKKDSALRLAMQSGGWLKHLPALVDENGVVIVGHRRIKIANELGIKHVIETIKFGTGDDADTKRLELAIASNIGFKEMTKNDRKQIAVYLYNTREWTLERIAGVLGVGRSTVQRDLDLPNVGNSKHEKTKDNPKGSGRPKGAKKKKDDDKPSPKPTSKPTHKPQPKPDPEEDDIEAKIIAFWDAGVSTKDIALEVGMGERHINGIIAHEKIRRKAREEAEIDPKDLALSAKERLETAIKQHKRKLDMEFEQRVLKEVRLRVETTVLPAYNKKYAEYQRVVESRKGVMDKVTHKKILACLHPDRVTDDDGLKKKYEEAFHLFNELTIRLLSEKDHPTESMNFPRTYQEMMEMRRKVSEQRKAKRAGSMSHR